MKNKIKEYVIISILNDKNFQKANFIVLFSTLKLSDTYFSYSQEAAISLKKLP